MEQTKEGLITDRPMRRWLAIGKVSWVNEVNHVLNTCSCHCFTNEKRTRQLRTRQLSIGSIRNTCKRHLTNKRIWMIHRWVIFMFGLALLFHNPSRDLSRDPSRDSLKSYKGSFGGSLWRDPLRGPLRRPFRDPSRDTLEVFWGIIWGILWWVLWKVLPGILEGILAGILWKCFNG